MPLAPYLPRSYNRSKLPVSSRSFSTIFFKGSFNGQPERFLFCIHDFWAEFVLKSLFILYSLKLTKSRSSNLAIHTRISSCECSCESFASTSLVQLEWATERCFGLSLTDVVCKRAVFLQHGGLSFSVSWPWTWKAWFPNLNRRV